MIRTLGLCLCLLWGAMVGVARADECRATREVSFDAFMAGGVSTHVPLTLRVPEGLAHARLLQAPETYAYWMTPEAATRAARSGDLDGVEYLYGKLSLDVGYDRERAAFVDGEGRAVGRMIHARGLGRVQQVATQGHAILFVEIAPGAGERPVYAAYVALNVGTNAAYLAYRPAADDPDAGACVWRAIKAALVADGRPTTIDAASDSLQSAVMAHDDWTADLPRCPAELIGDRAAVESGPSRCGEDGDGDAACLARCASGSAGDCYWLAQSLQAGGAEQASETLFARACRLGVPSACTNRAAGRFMREHEAPEALQCVYRSFEKSCRQEDPWGCTMQGMQLSEGKGVARDPALARRALEGGCRLGQDDPACAAAREILERLDADAER